MKYHPVSARKAEDALGGFAILSRPVPEREAEDHARHRIGFDDRAAVWSVSGGYLAAALLRSSASLMTSQRPTALSVQYLRAVSPGETEIESERLKAGAVSLVAGVMRQDGRPCVLSHAWGIDVQDAPRLCADRMPPAPHPDELKSIFEHLAPTDKPRPRFFDMFDDRPINRVAPQDRRNPSPQSLRWLRYRDFDADADPYLRAAYTLPIIDMLGVPAASNAYGSNVLVSIAPTIQLTAHFYELGALDGWLLGDAHAEHVGDGMINTRVKIWSERGALVAQGLSQMVFRSGQGAFVDKAKTSAAVGA